MCWFDGSKLVRTGCIVHGIMHGLIRDTQTAKHFEPHSHTRTTPSTGWLDGNIHVRDHRARRQIYI